MKSPTQLIKYESKKINSLTIPQSKILNIFINNKTVEYEDVKRVYADYYLKCDEKGIPLFWDYVDQVDEKGLVIKKDNGCVQRVGQWVIAPEGYVRAKTFGWLKNCIGILVFKGYLKVIPNLNFEE